MTPRRARLLPLVALIVVVVAARGAGTDEAPGPMVAGDAPRSIEFAGVAEVSAEGTKRALIIAISEYGTPPNHPETGEPLRPYRTLNAKNDIPLVRGALEQQGFEDIRLLQDADADIEGIRAALRRLVRDTDEGDVIVVHYSGHGHRITNDNPDEDDEVDGYDEVLVPYGAPDDFYEGYDGALHFRDDELGTFVLDLRRRAGVSGNVTIFLDACYTGTGTRGGPELPARGSEDPLGPPARASAPVTVAGDGTGMEEARGAPTRGGPEELAPFVVFSAASQRQVAYETWDVDGKTKVGSLSYAIARTLPKLSPGTTNRALFAEITRTLSGKVMQTPQMEGAADAQVFSNRLSQQFPYVVVDSVESGAAVLAGGSLIGLNEGTLLAVHPLGTNVPDSSTEIATLRVVEATATTALAEVTGGTLSAEHAGAWSFVTQRTYGDLGLRVALDPSLRAADRDGLAARLSETGIIGIVEDGPDVMIEDRNGIPVARTAIGRVELAAGAVDIVRVVEDFARNRYLRRLTFEAADIEVALDFAPVELETDRLGRPTGCGPANWDVTTHGSSSLGGQQWALSPGDVYRIQARNVGQRRAFVAVLDLQPRGAISVLRPRDDEAPSSYELDVDGAMDLGCYQLDDEEGLEVLKLFATRAPQDFRAMFETRGTRSGSGGDLSALEAVLASTYTATRSSEVGQPEGAATTRSVTIRVTPN